MNAETIKTAAIALWMTTWVGGLHTAYIYRDRSPLGRKVFNVYKAIFRKREDAAMLDALILTDVIVAFLAVVTVVAALAR